HGRGGGGRADGRPRRRVRRRRRPDRANRNRRTCAGEGRVEDDAAGGRKDLYEHLKKTARAPGGLRPGGTVPSPAEAGLKAADKTIAATYTIAYIAHTPLEPRAAVAEWEGDKVTVWTGTQRPFGVRDEVASAMKVPADKVRVIVPDMGSGYGGKHSGEAAVEAARLAKAAGKPVKV